MNEDVTKLAASQRADQDDAHLTEAMGGRAVRNLAMALWFAIEEEGTMNPDPAPPGDLNVFFGLLKACQLIAGQIRETAAWRQLVSALEEAYLEPGAYLESHSRAFLSMDW